jgi:hypothetical protein
MVKLVAPVGTGIVGRKYQTWVKCGVELQAVPEHPRPLAACTAAVFPRHFSIKSRRSAYKRTVGLTALNQGQWTF